MKEVKPVYKTIQSVIGFKTSDGEIFDDPEKAQEHQQYLDYKEELYCLFDGVFDDYLEEHCKDNLPFNDRYLEETLQFLAANVDLKSFILELQKIQDTYINKG